MRKFLYIISLFLLFACTANNKNIVQKYPQNPNIERKQRAGNLLGYENGYVIVGNKIQKDNQKEENNIKEPKTINDNLWKKSVLTVSNILPITIADDSTGLIATDWGIMYNITGNYDLYKINVIVKSTEINANNLQVSVFKKDYNGKIFIDNLLKEKIKKLILQ